MHKKRKEKEMLSLKYLDEQKTYSVSFNTISKNIVQIAGDFPVKTSGFILSREDKEDNWDYSAYTTVYREIEGRVQFSNDGSTYVPPIPPTPPEPYIPTLEEVKEAKVVEMNAVQQSIIEDGVTVKLSDGSEEHFTLTEKDQLSLFGLKDGVNDGEEKLPWHVDDESIHCCYYTPEDTRIITKTAKRFVTFHVTYFRDLRIYIRSLETKEDVEAITYGIMIPEEYQSVPLKDMLAAQNT